MNVTPLDARRKEILQAVVEAYIESALPISSQVVARRIYSRVSAATVRNVMAELDVLGLIWQPHTSAGRIPTDRGYRYYIDALLEPEQLTLEEQQLIQSRCPRQHQALDELLGEFLCILSSFSRYTALAFSFLGREKLYFEGTSFILEHPEFQSARKSQIVLKAFERRQPLLEVMREDLKQEGIKVHVGSENPSEDIRDCSLVISNFKIKNRSMGALGIIGPRRMAYPRVISTVDYVARILNEKIA